MFVGDRCLLNFGVICWKKTLALTKYEIIYKIMTKKQTFELGTSSSQYQVVQYIHVALFHCPGKYNNYYKIILASK